MFDSQVGKLAQCYYPNTGPSVLPTSTLTKSFRKGHLFVMNQVREISDLHYLNYNRIKPRKLHSIKLFRLFLCTKILSLYLLHNINIQIAVIQPYYFNNMFIKFQPQLNTIIILLIHYAHNIFLLFFAISKYHLYSYDTQINLQY